MSDYIYVSDVEGLIGDTAFDSGSTPTLSEIETFIEWVEAEVNARLHQVGVSVPVDATESIKLVRACVLWGVGALTLEAILAMGTGDAEQARLDRWWKFYERALLLILSGGGALLYDADRETDPRINMLPTIFGDQRAETVDHKLTFRELAAKTQYLNERDVGRTIASWKGALAKVR